MSVDLTFEANSGLGWIRCSTSGNDEGPWCAAICPLCQKQFLDPLFMDFVREQYDKHMLEHAKMGEPHEAVP